MIRQKSSISPEHRVLSILSLSTYWTSVTLSWSPRTPGNILGLSSTGNCYFTSILSFMPTKQSQQSSIWKSLKIPLEASFLFRNNFFTEVASFPLPYMVINYGFTTKPLYLIHLESLTKYNIELLSEFLAHSVPSHLSGLRPSLVSSPSISTFTN